MASKSVRLRLKRAEGRRYHPPGPMVVHVVGLRAWPFAYYVGKERFAELMKNNAAETYVEQGTG